MNLDIRDLELLEALASEGTLIGAAERLFVSQPALSQRLTKMEERLGVRVFERQGRRLVPNTAGRRLLPTAVQILRDLRATEAEVRELGRNGHQRVRVATQCSTTFSWLTPVMRRFRSVHPDTQVRVETVPGDDVAEALVSKRIDVGVLTKLSLPTEQLSLTHLFDDHLVCVVAPNHPWARRRHVTARDFTDADVILYDSYDPARVPAIPLPLPPGARPRTLVTVPLVTDLVVELVAGGEGVSVLPSWVVAPHVDAGEVVTVPMGARPVTRRWYAGVRTSDERVGVHAFVEGLREHFATAGQPMSGPAPSAMTAASSRWPIPSPGPGGAASGP